jgi:hypothetical protein
MIMFFITMEALPDEPVTTDAAVSCNGSWICMSIPYDMDPDIYSYVHTISITYLSVFPRASPIGE